MVFNKKSIWEYALIAVGLVLHVIGISRPFLGNFAQHQTDYATVVANFIQKGINPFMPLMKFAGEGKELLFLGDLPITMTIVAALCRFTNFSIEFWGRGLSAIFFLLSLYPFYRSAFLITKDAKAAFLSLVFYIFSPLTIVYGQSFLLEMPALFFLILSLCLMLEWQDRRLGHLLVISAICASLAISLRLYFGFYLIFVGYIFLREYRGKILAKWQPYFYLATALFLFIVWQSYAAHTAKIHGVLTSVEDNLTVFNITKNFPDRIIFKAQTYKTWLDTLLNKLATPIGFVMAFLGIFYLKFSERRSLFFVYILAFLAMFLAAPRKFFEFDYYFMPLVPALSIMAGVGLAESAKKILQTASFRLCLGCIILIFSMRYAFAPAFITPQEDKNVIKAAEYVKSIVPESSRMIASHGTSTSFLYYCDRTGWAFPTDEFISTAVRFPEDSAGTAINRLERFRGQGAEFFAITDKKNLEANRRLYDYMAANYKVALEKDGILIFDLRRPCP